MKQIAAIIGTMLGFYIIGFWILPNFNFYRFIFPWGGVTETHLHPVYMGIILLSGLIVACTIIILESVKGSQKYRNGKEIKNESKITDAK